MTPPPELVSLAKQIAEAHQLYPELVCAIVERESQWNQFAIRYEPAFMSRYVAPAFQKLGSDMSGTEAYSRAFSWGLMQLMGQCARERGFTGKFLCELCEPAIGIEFGCKEFAAKLAAAGGNVGKALLLWNGGSNLSYGNEVIALAAKYKV